MRKSASARETDSLVNEARPLLDKLAELLPKLQSLASEKGDSEDTPLGGESADSGHKEAEPEQCMKVDETPSTKGREPIYEAKSSEEE